MLNYVALKAELADSAYSGKSDAEILAALNAKTVTVQRPVPNTAVKQYMIRSSILGAAAIYAQTTGNDETLRAACQSAHDAILFDAFATFDLGTPTDKADIDAFCTALITAGCMTSAQQTEMYALQNVAVPWAPGAVGIATITQPDLDLARAA